jgi:hypothetical protein
MPLSIFVRLVFDNKKRLSTSEPKALSCPNLSGKPEGLLERETESARRQRRVGLQ